MADLVKDVDDSAAPGAYGTVGVADAAKAKIGDIVRPFFNRFDRDKNGKLDIQEVENVFRDLGEHPTPDKMQIIFNELDADKSGEIDFEERVARRLLSLAVRSSGGR